LAEHDNVWEFKRPGVEEEFISEIHGGGADAVENGY